MKTINTASHRLSLPGGSRSLTMGAVGSLLLLSTMGGLPVVGRADDSYGNAAHTRHFTRHHKRPFVEIADARLKFEVNATDEDAGIQVFLDADPWRSMNIYDPFGRLLFRAAARGRLGLQGGTELFLESAEPEFSDVPLAEILDRFPEGVYHFRGRGLEGERYFGSATMTHNIPKGPTLVSPLAGQGLVDPNSAVVMWEQVEAPNSSPIVGYQVLVVQLESEFPAIPKVALDVIMPATATSMAVPAGFLLPDTEYEWEVLAIESGGNQTLSSSFFTTAPAL